jgi:hypothetical protein
MIKRGERLEASVKDGSVVELGFHALHCGKVKLRIEAALIKEVEKQGAD